MMQAFIGMSQQAELVEYFKHKSNCMVQCRNRFYLASIKSTKRSFLYGYDPRITLILEIITKMVLQKLVSVLNIEF
jgi:hypothetical protein